MMKKLLVLSLVLGIASLATANLALTIEGDQVVTPGESISFDIVNAVDFGAFFTSNWLLVSDAGTLNPSGDGLPGTVIAQNNGIYNVTLPGYFGTSSNLSLSTAPAGTVFITATLDVTGPGVIELYSPAGESGDPGELLASVNVIPEPATMALLGLGALVLRRKK